MCSRLTLQELAKLKLRGIWAVSLAAGNIAA